MATSKVCGKRKGLVARAWVGKSLAGDHKGLEHGPDIIFLPKLSQPPPTQPSPQGEKQLLILFFFQLIDEVHILL